MSFFSVFISSMPSKVILIVIETQTHFSPRLAARAKMSLSRAQNIFMPANINSIVILLSLCRALWRILRAKMENFAG